MPAIKVCRIYRLLITAIAGFLLISCKGKDNATTPSIPAALTNWTWEAGSYSANSFGYFGTQGVASTLNQPSGRFGAMTWIDSTNQLWLFSGTGGYSDMWVFNTQSPGWIWKAGTSSATAGNYGTLGVAATSNVPGSRNFGATWVDTSGNFWLFGGYGTDSNGLIGYLNDVWMFNPGTNLWTWTGGASQGGSLAAYTTCTPGAAATLVPPNPRSNTANWKDNNGDFWMLGGQGYVNNTVGVQNDLWKFSPSTGLWTCIGGTSTLNTAGVYGTLGTAASTNQPGSRQSSTTWTDSLGNFWLFGGTGIDSASGNGMLNDLWVFDPVIQQWTYANGSTTINAVGKYGTNNQPSPNNQPGARSGSIGWTDSSGNRWLFGGNGINSSGMLVILNDLWQYQISSGQWLWINGSYNGNIPGYYGTMGVLSSGNMPGSRYNASGWTDSAGNFWLFGGSGFDAAAVNGRLSDMWKYVP